MPVVKANSMVAVMPMSDDMISTSSGEDDLEYSGGRGSFVKVDARSSGVRFSAMSQRMSKASEMFANSAAGALLRGASMQVANSMDRLNKMDSVRVPAGIGGAPSMKEFGQFGTSVVQNDVKQLLKAASTIFVDVMKEKKMPMFATLITIAWVTCSNSVFSILAKICMQPARDQVPNILYVCAITNLISMCGYLFMIALHPDRSRLFLELFKAKPHLASIVPSFFYMAMYQLGCITNASVSSALMSCLLTGRQFVFAVLEYLCFGSRIGLLEFILLVTLCLGAAAHASTVPIDPLVTPRLALGCIQAMFYCVVSGIAIIYFSWAVPKFKLDALVSGCVTCFQVAIWCFLYETLVMYMATGQPWGIEEGFRWDNTEDLLMLGSWVSTDMSYFFCPLWLSGLHLGLAQALCIPFLFIFEVFYYTMPILIPQLMTCVTLFVLLFALLLLKN